MTHTVEFPDPVAWAVGWLAAGLAANGYPGINVSDAYTGAPVEVWVSRDGGGQSGPVLESARIRVNVFSDGASPVDVSTLARRVVAVMLAGAGDGPVKRVSVSTGPTPIPEVRPRRYMLFDVDLKAADLTLS